MYWDPSAECMERELLEELQLERLEAVLSRVARNVPCYRRMFETLGAEPEDIRSVEDLSRLPFTSKDVLRDNYPYGFFAVPLREVVRLQASSGTTGQPVVVGYTRNDLRKWSGLVARVLVAGGVSREDVVQIAFHYGLFTGGLGHHYGAEMLGAAVIPASSGSTRRQVRIMQDYRTTALCCTPSYALHLAESLEAVGVNVNSLSLKFGLFGGETWSERMRREIEDRLKIKATDNYGLTEVMGPGLAGECLEQGGMHLAEDHFLAEIVDPETGKGVAEGEIGELVITTLAKEAFPVLRYRTGDLTRFIPGRCACGRTTRRIDRILGRVDDMLIIKGVNVFPSQIEAVLLEDGRMSPHYQIVLSRHGALDQALVLVEASEEAFFDQMREQQQYLEGLKRRLHSELGVGFEVRLVEHGSLERSEGKAKRVVDRRSI